MKITTNWKENKLISTFSIKFTIHFPFSHCPSQFEELNVNQYISRSRAALKSECTKIFFFWSRIIYLTNCSWKLYYSSFFASFMRFSFDNKKWRIKARWKCIKKWNKSKNHFRPIRKWLRSEKSRTLTHIMVSSSIQYKSLSRLWRINGVK